MSNWWTEAQLPSPVRSDSHEWVFQWAQQALAIQAMKNGGPAPIRVGAAGNIVDADVHEKLNALLKEVDASKVEESFYVWDDDFEEVYVWATGAAFVTTTDENVQLGVNLVTTDADFAEKVRAFLHTHILRRATSNRGRVYVLVNTPEGVRPSPLGFAAVPLELENYEESIQGQIQKMVLDHATPFPDGRLTILEGPPGCGKTFLIRSLVHEVPRASFIFVPPAMIPHIGDPSLVTGLLSMRSEESEDNYQGPTVLICEDADSILTQRMADNMPGISSVLNLTSGLLGDLIDVRVIATTNAQRSDIEPALMRNGRLAQYIQVPPVSRSQADLIVERLVGHKTPIDWPAAKIPSRNRRTSGSIGFSSNEEYESLASKVLLADIFKVARSQGWKPTKAVAKLSATKIRSSRPRPYKEEEGAAFYGSNANKAETVDELA